MKKISVVAMSVAILLLIGSCAQRNGNEATPKPTLPVTKVTETPKPTPTATATPTTNLNAKPVPGSCLVLEERYCKTVISITDHGYILAAFKLPVGTPIFSPYGGVISTTGRATVGVGGPEVPVVSISTMKAGKQAECLCGTDLLEWLLVRAPESKSLLTVKPIYMDDKGAVLAKISKGKILARIGETNITMKGSPFDLLNTYNLVMYFNILGDVNLSNAKTKSVFGISQQK